MFARFQNALCHLEVRGGNGQVDDQINVICGQKPLDRLGANALIIRRPCVGRIHVDVSHSPHFKRLEIRRKVKIGGRDISASNDANT